LCKILLQLEVHPSIMI